MAYKDAYRNLDSRIVELTRNMLVRDRFYRMNDQQKLEAMRGWLTEASAIYNIACPSFRIGTPLECSGSGCYRPLTKEIILPKFSVVTLLHEFKHHMQHETGRPNNEEVARGWSVSLFYQASPSHYESAISKGLLLFN